MGNDFWDAETFDLWLKSGAGGSYMVWRDFGQTHSTSLSLQQPIGSLVSSLYYRAKVIAGKTSVGNLLIDARRRLMELGVPAIVMSRSLGDTHVKLRTGDYKVEAKLARPSSPAFGLVVDALRSIDLLAKKNGAAVLIVLQHSKEEVYLPLFGQTIPDLYAPLRATLTELGIPYLDLLDDFRRRAGKGEALFFETDSHPNARGYALIAERVIYHLKQHAREYGIQETYAPVRPHKSKDS